MVLQNTIRFGYVGLGDLGRQLLAELDEPIRRATKDTLAHMKRERLELLRELLDETRSAPQPE